MTACVARLMICARHLYEWVGLQIQYCGDHMFYNKNIPYLLTLYIEIVPCLGLITARKLLKHCVVVLRVVTSDMAYLYQLWVD
jgi:hypothetical protein